jgi:hypothetical protein
MPHTYTIDKEQGIITVVFIGDTGADELRATAIEITNDPAYKPQHHILNDLRTCILTLTHAELIEFTRLFGEKFVSLNGKSAILMDAPHTTAIAMLHQQKTNEARTTKLFTTHEAAIAWLKSN